MAKKKTETSEPTKPRAARKPRAREPVDEQAARELELYTENEYALVGAENSIGKNIERMLQKKVDKGKFDVLASVRAWMYLIDEAAKRYTKEFGSGSPVFNKPTREFVAARFAKEWAQEHAGHKEH